MIKRLLLTLAATLACFASAQAQISVGPTGSSVVTLDTAPADTSTFSTLPVAGGGTTYLTVDQVDAAIQALDQSSINTVLPTSATVAPSTSALGFRYNTALHVIQSRPTGVAGVLLKAILRNDSGANISSFTIAYDFASQSPATSVGDLPAHIVYWSLTGAPGTWTRIPELSDGNEAAGIRSANLAVGSWTAGSSMYIVWADDNADAITDPSYTIDNISITLPGVPPHITTQPTNTTVIEGQVATLSAAANGSAPLTFQWYKGANPIPGATQSTLLVTNTAGSGLTWSVPGDSGSYYVIVTGSANPPAQSSTVTVTVTPDTVAPIAEWANGTANPVEVVVNLSESLSDTADVTNLTSWAVELVGVGNLNITNISHTPGSPRVHIMVDIPLDPANKYVVENTIALADRASTPNFLPANTRLPILISSNNIAGLSMTWKYSDIDVDLPANWIASGYVDTGAEWKSGAGPLDAKKAGGGAAGTDCRDVITHYPDGVGLGPVGTCINLFSPGTANQLTTVYFRTHFSSPVAGGSNALLHLQGKVDDGAVIYLNGVEIGRVGMPTGPITRTTLANRTVGDDNAQDALEFYVPNMVAGDNVLAIEVHQAALTSTDITMGLDISIVTGGLKVGPRLTITRDPSDPGRATVDYTGSDRLQFNVDLGDAGGWSDVPEADYRGLGPNGSNSYTVFFSDTPRLFFRTVQ